MFLVFQAIVHPIIQKLGSALQLSSTVCFPFCLPHFDITFHAACSYLRKLETLQFSNLKSFLV